MFFSIFAFCANVPVYSSSLEILSCSAKNSGIDEISVIIPGEKEVVLIDPQWKPSDAKNVAKMIADSGRTLTHILITHGHSDHYWVWLPFWTAFRYQIKDNKIVADRAAPDNLGFLMQFGVLQPTDMTKQFNSFGNSQRHLLSRRGIYKIDNKTGVLE